MCIGLIMSLVAIKDAAASAMTAAIAAIIVQMVVFWFFCGGGGGFFSKALIFALIMEVPISFPFPHVKFNAAVKQRVKVWLLSQI